MCKRLVAWGPSPTDLSGQVFGKLTAIDRDPARIGHGAYWLCRCECGGSKSVRSDALRAGVTLSCGCLSREKLSLGRQKGHNERHGLSDHFLYPTWSGMLARCNNPRNTRYADYGGRGIGVCERWLCVENFIADMAGSYKEGLSLDRKDNDLGYHPKNCRWATLSEQANNKRKRPRA